MDEEFKSFLVTNPDIIDEGIDVSGIRQATEQDKLIAGAIAEEPGLAYDPRLTSYLSDLNRYFSGGFPTISTPPTTTHRQLVETEVEAEIQERMGEVDLEVDLLIQELFGGQPTFYNNTRNNCR
jgi:hypothetical protein